MESHARSVSWWASLSLFAIGCWTFAPAVQFDFVNWDDPAYVWHNELIKSWSPANLSGIATESVTRNYAPLTIGSLLIDYTLWGMNAGGYHATNILLHALNGVFVYLLIRQLTQHQMVAWTTAALFLIHPVQIETVAWISSRKGLLSATFMLAALIVRLRPTARASDDGWYIGLLTAALLSKALAVVVPPMVLIYDVFVRRDKFTDALVRQVIPGLLSLLLMLHTMATQNAILGGVRSHMDLSLPEIVAIDITILSRYLRMLCCPVDLCVLYDPPTTGILWPVLGGAAAWLTAISVCWSARRSHPLVLWSLGCFLLLLFPVLNFFRITTLMNDRYLYLPCIPIFALATGILWWSVNSVLLLSRRAPASVVFPTQTGASALRLIKSTDRWWTAARLNHVTAGFFRRIPQILAGGVTCSVLSGLMAVTDQHLPVWQNSHSLWAHAMQHVPQLSVVRIQLALTLHDSGRTREAIAVLQQAQRDCDADIQDQERMTKAIQEWTTELSQVALKDSSSK